VHPATPGSTLAAFLIAVAAATGVRLVFGTSVGRPGLDDVGLALRALGVFATDLRPPRREVSGVFAVEAEEAATGAPLLLKIYGRDAYDTQLLATFWRRLWYQDGAVPFGVGRLQAVEREALVTLLAARAGVATREVAVAGATPAGDALLVLRGAAEPLAHLGADSVELRPYWESLEQLHAAGIAHREIDATTVGLVRGLPGFVDLGRAATTLAPDQLQADRAQLLAATAAVAGERRAVTEAVAAIGDDGVANLLPYLQMPAFGPELRRSLKAGAVDVDELRRSASLAAGAAEPELARLRRVTWGSAVQIALLVLAVGALVKIVGGVDYDELATDLADATWGWIAVAMVVAQLPRLTQAAASLGSIAAELRFGPVYVLQLASSYLNLALPSSLARMAVSIRFFQRQGQPPAAAVTAGAIGSVTGTAVQALLVSTIVLFSSHDLPLDLTTPSGGSLRLLSILAGLLVLTVLAVAAIGRVRRRLVHRVRVWWPQVATSLTALRAPNKLLLLVGGTIATEVLFAAALGLTTRAFGAHIPLSELIVVNSGVSLLSSLIPVPGGIGVVELGLEVGLTSAGMTPSAALAAIALYRVATFYLPPAWGFFAFRWLQQNRYL